MRLFSWFRKKIDILDDPSIEFHYVSRATRPDMVIVHKDGVEIERYNWIDGEDSIPKSRLHQLHARYRQQGVTCAIHS